LPVVFVPVDASAKLQINLIISSPFIMSFIRCFFLQEFGTSGFHQKIMPYFVIFRQLSQFIDKLNQHLLVLKH